MQNLRTLAALSTLRDRQEHLEAGLASISGVSGAFSSASPAVKEFWVQVTGVDGSTPPNYSWNEQTWTATGGFQPLPYGRQGTATVQPAQEANGFYVDPNVTPSLYPFYTRLRNRGINDNGQPILDFDYSQHYVLTVSDSQPPTPNSFSGINFIRFADTGTGKAFTASLLTSGQVLMTLNVSSDCFNQCGALNVGTSTITNGGPGNLLVDSGGKLTEWSPAQVGIAAGGTATGLSF